MGSDGRFQVLDDSGVANRLSVRFGPGAPVQAQSRRIKSHFFPDVELMTFNFYPDLSVQLDAYGPTFTDRFERGSRVRRGSVRRAHLYVGRHWRFKHIVSRPVRYHHASFRVKFQVPYAALPRRFRVFVCFNGIAYQGASRMFRHCGIPSLRLR